VSRIRTLRRTALATVVAGAAVAGVVSFTGGAAGAVAAAPKPPKSTTVEYTLPVPALPVTNLCNADAVVLDGNLYIRTTTTPQKNGAVKVESVINGKDLTGFGLPSALNYLGENREYSYQYIAQPPYPSTYRDVQYTKLIPQGNAPAMYLVVVLRQVVLGDGTVLPTIEQAYLVCQQPTPSCKKV